MIQSLVISLFQLLLAPYAPPNDIHVETVDADQVKFVWSEVTSQCPCIRYIISADNCGLCPNSTVDTTVTCTNISSSVNVLNSICLFALQTETCGSILGEKSEYASADMFSKEYNVFFLFC